MSRAPSLLVAVCLLQACGNTDAPSLPADSGIMLEQGIDTVAPAPDQGLARDQQLANDQNLDLGLTLDTSSGCTSVTPGAGQPISVMTVAQVAGHPTLFTLSWETAKPTRGVVHFGLSAKLELASAASKTLATSHKELLKGLPVSTAYQYRVTTVTDTGACHQADGKGKTGALPADFPLLTLAASIPAEAAGGYTVVPLLSPKVTWLVILDALGKPVWFYKTLGAILRVRLSLDAKAILFHRETPKFGTDSYIVRMPLDGGPTVETKILDSHTDFVEYEDHKYAVLSRTVRSFGGGTRKLLSETILTVDEGGKTKELWNAFDHIAPDLSQAYNKGIYDPDPSVEAWSHFNSISYHNKDRAFLVTARNLDTVVKVSRDTGKNLWVMGAIAAATIKVSGNNSLVNMPHSAQQLAGSVLVFNNNTLQPGECSHVVEVGIAGGKESQLWFYNPAACYQIGFLGDATRLWNGNTMVAWTTSGRLEEVTKAKKLVWAVQSSLGAGFGYSTRVQSLYP